MQKEISPSPLSFDTSFIKFFCKTPEIDETSSNLKRAPKKTEKKADRNINQKSTNCKFLFETDPSFEDLSMDLIKSMKNDDIYLSKEKFDGNFLINFILIFIFLIRITSDNESQ